MSPTLTRKCLSSKSRENSLSSPSMVASSLDKSFSKKNFIQYETISHPKLSDLENKSAGSPTKITKNAATSCFVLTRDIGISYVPNKFKSVAVGSDISFQELIKTYTNKKGFDQFTSVSSESLESDSESLGGSDEQSRSFLRSRLRKTLPSSYKTSNIPIIKTLNSSTNTITKYYLNKHVNTDELSPKSPVTKPSEKLTFNKSSLAVPSLSTKSVQTFEKRTFRSIGLQTMQEVKPVEKRNSLNEKRVTKCDASVGDFNVSDILCAACNKVKKSVGVGDFSIKSVVCDQCSSFWPRSKATVHKDGNCENCVLRQTETVGVGDYDVNQVDCQNCDHEKSENLEKVKSNSVATNTALDSSSNLSVSKSDMHICDKCSATIQSVAQGFAANTSDSKIPRPNLKISTVGKTNHTKLAKLRTQVSKTQKTEAGSFSSVEKQGSTIQGTKRYILSYSLKFYMVLFLMIA